MKCIANPLFKFDLFILNLFHFCPSASTLPTIPNAHTERLIITGLNDKLFGMIIIIFTVKLLYIFFNIFYIRFSFFFSFFEGKVYSRERESNVRMKKKLEFFLTKEKKRPIKKEEQKKN